MNPNGNRPCGTPGRPDRWLVAAIVTAVAVRVALALWPPAGGGQLHLPDSRSYTFAAETLLDKGELWFGVIQRAKREPGYPLFVAGCFGLLGRHVLAVRVTQAVLCGLLCLPVHALACRLGGRRAGCAAAWIAALYPNLAVSSILVLTEGLFTLLLWTAMCSVGSAEYGMRSGSRRRMVLVGSALCWGALAALRSEALALFAGVAMVALLVRRNRRDLLPIVVSGLVGLVLVTGVWAARNRRVVGHPVMTTLNVGETLYDSFWSGADGSSDKRFMKDIQATETWRAMSDARDEVGQNRWLKEMALDYARTHPRRVVDLAWRKAALTWRPAPGGRAGMDRRIRAALGAAFLAVTAAAVVGVVRCRRDWRTWIVWFVPMAVVTATHLVIVGSIRYRIPVVPFLVVMAGAAVRQRRRPGV